MARRKREEEETPEEESRGHSAAFLKKALGRKRGRKGHRRTRRHRSY